MVLSVIVPVRDEQASLAACLESLVAQSEPGWVLGEHWELLVVDDGSTDRTRKIAEGFAGVRVLAARAPLPKSWTGKCNACWTGAEAARGTWLLFTEARTVHHAGSASRAMVEAERYKAAMLSYWPRQATAGVLERALLPLVFSELATAYPAARVNDPAKRIAMAMGAFLLVRAEAYRGLGGHAAVAASLVEDVDLAFLAKGGKVGLRFRYAPEALELHVRAGFGAMWQAWVRKLALLIHNSLALAAWRVLDVVLVWGLLLLALLYPAPFAWERIVLWLLWVRNLWRVYRRAARSNFAAGDVALSIALGLPLFAALAYASWYRTRVLRRVSWKGREYRVGSRR